MSVIVTPTAIKEVGDIMKQQNLNPARLLQKAPP